MEIGIPTFYIQTNARYWYHTFWLFIINHTSQKKNSPMKLVGLFNPVDAALLSGLQCNRTLNIVEGWNLYTGGMGFSKWRGKDVPGKKQKYSTQKEVCLCLHCLHWPCEKQCDCPDSPVVDNYCYEQFSVQNPRFRVTEAIKYKKSQEPLRNLLSSDK